jgi:uncharacterized protein
MVEVTIDSVRVSLMTQQRVIVLKDTNADRYLPIWIGPFEADAITLELQAQRPARPLTHDLINLIIQEFGGRLIHVMVSDLRNDVFYARLVVDVDGKQIEIDSRPSDAIAVAVRAKVPIYVNDNVMDKASIEPDEDVESEALREGGENGEREEVDEGRLSAFADFVNSLDLDDLDDEDK